MHAYFHLLARLASAGTIAVGLAASASAQHFDIFVTNLGGAKTGIGAADVDGGHFDIDARVFEAVMIAGGAPDYSRNEPGFFALSDLASSGLFPAGASALPANSTASFSFNTFLLNGNMDDLFYWDGIGEVDFQPATFAGISLSDADEMASDHGALDFHPDFQIDNPTGTAADGVYLASVSAAVTGLAPSSPVYLALLVDASITNELIAEELEEAIEAGTAFQFFEEAVEYVELRVVPEPAALTVGLLAVGVLLVGGRLQRRGG
jgi:hypothetical protein